MRVALVRGALFDYDLASGRERLLSPGKPLALAWSPDGMRLAVADRDLETTRLRLLSENGTLLAEATVPGNVDRLFWDGDDAILTVAVTIQTYSFGGNLSATLVRWDGEAPPRSTPLFETSLKPLTLRTWGSRLYSLPQPTLSPWGDELLFARLHDPPAFAPYLKIVARHRQSGAERVVARVALTSAATVYLGDGERILYGDGSRRTLDAPLWGGDTAVEYPWEGRALAASPGGRYRLVDGHLLDQEKEIAIISGVERAVFSPSGNRLLLAKDGRLWVLGGLGADPLPGFDPALGERLRRLRSWRARGLITDGDYREQKARMVEGTRRH
ncbi:hypothetical protein DSOUD_1990 [Desulfuromonas soudanensis]|uniref:WD40 repeat domain-containing protein n=1 Tax=Desulfuromonas soudanensis TaxID=1603606 RepID=A0A0M4D1P3_9BACT|nr:hypothetical protein [Desulfuromonas soudanensis]ALC16758.1 hypothetical protein DSOUD_1990 [Desulfuromonas soudanensis]